MRQWVKLPSRWIEEGGLANFEWGREGGSSQTAALMVLLAIAHHTSLEDGTARLTYDTLQWATHLSRTKIADGLDILADRDLLVRAPAGRSTFQLANYNPKRGWSMIPAKKLYTSQGIAAFSDFSLRKKTELDALKAYLSFAARRDSKFNRAHITYKQLEKYAGISQARIKAAISLLLVNELIVVDQKEREGEEFGMSFAYRLKHLSPRIHQGTTDRVEEATLASVLNRPEFPGE